MTKYRDQSWSIAPGAWPVHPDDECVTITIPSADAAVQLSAYRKVSADVTLDELEDFTDRKGHGEQPKPATFGDFRGFGVEYEDAGLQWRCWWVGSGPIHLFITHTAGSHPEMERSRAEVDRVLQTLKVESDSPAV